MRIEIAPDAADDPDAHRWLDRILHKIDDGWHVWDTTHLAEPDEIESTTWVHERGTQGDWVRELLVTSIKHDAWTLSPHERRIRVTALPAVADELKPEDAARLAVRRKCAQREVACWILAKREAENYLPRVLLDARPDSGLDHFRLVEAWSRLNDDQKDFFDMKHGLLDEPSQTERELFVELSPVDREILSNGFGSEVHECWNVWGIQDNAAKAGLLRRGRGDLERGIELIRKEV